MLCSRIFKDRYGTGNTRVYIYIQQVKYRVLNFYYRSIQFRDQIRFIPREKKKTTAKFDIVFAAMHIKGIKYVNQKT